ncbi:hypothetical protein EYC82_08245 [Halieaceae bacterium IMCC11814]|uniref:Cysteine-rich CWC n=2 Tax=Candidatus Marimicrobium litorale TaxID=2518991 RepID=A0ABT3T4Z4_9GAMM|nr:hypothetical protein [Candidatus Marimicrobium litorale]
MNPPDASASTCPLCGKDNQCAIAAGREPATCWCWSANLDPLARERAADTADQQCICAHCGRLENGERPDEG